MFSRITVILERLSASAKIAFLSHEVAAVLGPIPTYEQGRMSNLVDDTI